MRLDAVNVDLNQKYHRKRGLKMTTPIMEVNNLNKYFPIKRGLLNKTVGHVKLLNDITFRIYEGQSFGYIGETGCGKTMLAYCLSMIYKPTSGKVLFMGKNILNMNNVELNKIRKDFQLVYQDPLKSLPPFRTIGEILEEPLIVQGIGNRKEQRLRALDILGKVGIQDNYYNRFPKQLSGGQQQRIGIARALILKPRLIIFDQPVSALDVSIQAQVLNLLSELRKGTTYLIATNNLSVLRHVCFQTAVMYLGRFIEVGLTETICTKPMHPYTKMLVDIIPDMEEELNKKDISVRIPDQDLPDIWHIPKGCPYKYICKRKKDICENEYPALNEVEPGHLVACHFPLTD